MEALPVQVPPEWRTLVERILKAWSGYQLGIEQNSGGDDTLAKHEWFGDVLAEYLVSSRGLTAVSLEEWINSILYADFDLVLEDDSVYPTAHFIIEAYRYLKNGDALRLQQLMGTLPSEEQLKEARRSSQMGKEESDEEVSDDAEEEDEDDEEKGDKEEKPKRERGPRMVTDDEGWTTIKKR